MLFLFASTLFLSTLCFLDSDSKVCSVHWLHVSPAFTTRPLTAHGWSGDLLGSQNPLKQAKFITELASYTAFPPFSSGSAPPPTMSNVQTGFHGTASFISQGTQFVPPSSVQPLMDELQQVQAEHKPLNVTVGVEFEMILAHSTYPNRAGGEISNTGKGKDIIYAMLTHQPLQVRCASCGELHTMKPRLHRPGAYYQSFGAWAIESDTTIELSMNERDTLGSNINYFDFYSIEIKTRILDVNRPLVSSRSATKPGHVHTVAFAEEIRAFLDRLNAGFSAGSEGGRSSFLVNDSCGLHVHVGNEHYGFPLRTVKNVLSTHVVNERAIDAMHAKHRIGGSTLALAPQNRKHGLLRAEPQELRAYNMGYASLHSMTVYSRREQAARGTTSPEYRSFGFMPDATAYPSTHYDNPVVRKAAYQYSAAAQITLIQHAPDVRTLMRMQCGYGHSSTVDLANLDEFHRFGGDKMTIEFRQHTGTLQPAEVLSWVDFLVKLVQHAHDTPDEEYANLLLGCSPQTSKHYKRVLGLQGTGPCYADALAAQDTTKVNIGGAGNLLAPLKRHLIRQRHDKTHPSLVSAHISRKFLAGAYGQFSDAYLDQLVFIGAKNVAARERLRVGYINPETRPASPKQSFRPRMPDSEDTMPLLPLRPDHDDPSPVSTTSANMVGYPLGNGDIVFTIQQASHGGAPRSPLTGSAYADYDENGEFADDDDSALHIEDIDAAQEPTTALTSPDRATMHPERLRRIDEAATLSAVRSQELEAEVEIAQNDDSDLAPPRERPAAPDTIVTTEVDWDRDGPEVPPPGFRIQPPPPPKPRAQRRKRVSSSYSLARAVMEAAGYAMAMTWP